MNDCLTGSSGLNEVEIVTNVNEGTPVDIYDVRVLESHGDRQRERRIAFTQLFLTTVADNQTRQLF